MKKIGVTILVFLCVISAFAQKDNLKRKLIDTAFTWRNASRAQIDSFYFQLLPLKYTNYKSHIRISLPERGQIIDLFGSNNKGYQGSLINYVQQYKKIKDKNSKHKRHEAFQYIYEEVELDSVAATEVAAYIEQSGLMNIHIDGRGQRISAVDCYPITFEYCSDRIYFKQEYKCPWPQASEFEQYRILVLSSYDFLKEKLNLEILSSNFIDKLLPGIAYSKNGSMMVYQVTKEEKERRDYLKSIRNVVDSYLKQKLDEQEIEKQGLNCLLDYYITFGKNGKLQRVEYFWIFNRKLEKRYAISRYFKEQRKVRRCKQKIRGIFKNIDLSFLDLQYGVLRIFSFEYDGSYSLRDPMIY